MGIPAKRNPETSDAESQTLVISDIFCKWLAFLA